MRLMPGHPLLPRLKFQHSVSSTTLGKRMRVVFGIGGLVSGLLMVAPLQSQQQGPEPVRARDVALDLSIDPSGERLSGSMTLDVENWTKKPASRVSFLLNRLMEASAVRDGTGAPLHFTQDVVRFRDTPMRQVTQILVDLRTPVAPGGHTLVRVDYAGNLVGYTEVGWLYVKDRIDTAFTIIRSDALAFPVIGGLSDAANRRIPTGLFTYRASVRVPSKYLVASGGTLSRTINGDGTITWTYVSGGPSPFMNIAVAPFDTLVDGGVRLFYFAPDSLGARRLMSGAKTALSLLNAWFGPLHSPVNLTITEIPDGWGSQASLVGGIIQSAAAFKDEARLGELYHELSHLWNVPDLENPSPRWNEGYAMFMQDLLRERVDAWGKRQESETQNVATVKKFIATDSTLRRVPMIDYGAAAMTDKSYWVGELMFATLFDLVGQAEFNKIVGGYYQRFATGGTTRDLIAVAKRTSSRDLTTFFDDWILTPHWAEVVANATSISDLAAHYSGKPAQPTGPGPKRNGHVGLARARGPSPSAATSSE